MSYVDGKVGGSKRNKNGGWYHPGDTYPHTKKVEIIEIYFDKWSEYYPWEPTYTEMGEAAKVTHQYAKKVIMEFKETGQISDPHNRDKTKKQKITAETSHFTEKEESFLLSLRAEDPSRPTASYVREVLDRFNKVVSIAYVNRWWLNRFPFQAKFKKASLIPMDKFSSTNWFRYFEYRMIVAKINDNLRFNFMDEKNVTNHNGVELRVRANPFTGKTDSIPVSGNFREARSLIACISVNPRKARHTYYDMTKEKVDAEYVMKFVMEMVRDGFLLPKEVLVLDNAAVHCGAAAKELEDFLWNVKVNGVQLQVLVLFLPTRAPELNPIELIFHILSRRIKSHHFRNIISINNGVEDMVRYVMDHIDRPLLMRCYEHCGYMFTDDNTENGVNIDNDTINDSTIATI